MEDKETTENATIRELSEETGYRIGIEQIKYIGKVAPDTATINCSLEVFKVIIPNEVMQGIYDTEEIDIPVRITLEEFKNKVRSGEIIDGITLASWTLANI